MKKILVGLLWAVSAGASAQVNTNFVYGQVLTAGALNAAFAQAANVAGGILTGPLTAPTLTVTGTLTIPVGSVPLTRLATQAANTVVANTTTGFATPTAVALPSCSTSTSALNYATGGAAFSCNTSINAATLGGATFASPPVSGYGSATPEPVAATTITATSDVSSLTTISASNTTGAATPTNSGAKLGAATNLGAVTFYDSTQSANNRTAQLIFFGGQLLMRFANDAGSSVVVPLAMTGGQASGITGISSNSGTGSWVHTGSMSISGAFTPSTTAGIVGTAAADNANAGSIGEFVTATNSGVALTNSTAANVTSISLTAGDWDVAGNVVFTTSGVTATGFVAGINTVSATMPGAVDQSTENFAVTGAATESLPGFVQRVNINTTTTVYLVGLAAFSAGTVTAAGRIRARRIR